ncbi:hypothetical protein [Streptomyces sp. NPDC003480]
MCADDLYVRTDPGGAWTGTLHKGQTFLVESKRSGWAYGFACTLYYTYFYGTDFTSDGEHWGDAAGAPSGTVIYRFTTRDGQAAVVRDTNLCWRFLPIGCVTRPSALYYDND